MSLYFVATTNVVGVGIPMTSYMPFNGSSNLVTDTKSLKLS